MHVGVLGINFKTAELALHETIARRAASLEFPHPVVLLSTCNRTEIYFSAENLVMAAEKIASLLQVQTGLYSYFEKDCFVHLCRVAAGLDSAIFMETEIVRQVKTAYAYASHRFVLSKNLHYLFQKAFKMAKSIRSQFLQRNGGPSLFDTLWQVAEIEFPDIQQKKILLVGYSETHRRLATFLRNKGFKNFTFCTRQPEKVLEENVCGRERLKDWSEYDVISCASQADDFLIRGKGKKRHLIFDLSVPRNVDPFVASANTKIFNIDQINNLVQQRKDSLGDFLEQSERMIEESVARLLDQYRMKECYVGS